MYNLDVQNNPYFSVCGCVHVDAPLGTLRKELRKEKRKEKPYPESVAVWARNARDGDCMTLEH